MREILEKIFNDFSDEKKYNTNNNKNQLVSYLKNNCHNSFYDTNLIDRNEYLIDFSTGKGGWAIIPWIAVFDKDISTSAAKGYDIVYLFSADMKKVYISLNQGWTYYKEKYKTKKGKEKIKQVVTMWQKRLKSNLGEFTYDHINLEYFGTGSDLPEGYELGHICGKCYNADQLPEEKVLHKDLQNMIALFRELKGHMSNLSIDETNNNLLAEFSNTLVEHVEDKGKTKYIDEIIANEGTGSILQIDNSLPSNSPETEDNSKNSKNNTKKSPTNYQEKNKKQERIGKIGEYIVLEHEKNKLKKLGINKKVEHVAVTQNDQAGYDIKSYNEKGEVIYIEVKTTEGNKNQCFYLTAKEKAILDQNLDNYFIYRLFNLDIKEKKADCYIIANDKKKNLKFTPETYKVNFL